MDLWFSFLTLIVVFLCHMMTITGTSVDPSKNLCHIQLYIVFYFLTLLGHIMTYAGTSVNPSKILCNIEEL